MIDTRIDDEEADRGVDFISHGILSHDPMYSQIHRVRKPLLRKAKPVNVDPEPEQSYSSSPEPILYKHRQPTPREPEQVDDVRKYIDKLRESIESEFKKAPKVTAKTQSAPALRSSLAESISFPEIAARREVYSADNSLPEPSMISEARQPINYKPATFSEYVKRYGPGKKWEQLGSLGPDLPSESALERKALNARLREFSEQLRRVNLEKQKRNLEIPKPKLSQRAQKTTREKALEFSKSLPPPAPQKKVFSKGPPLADLEISLLEKLKRHDEDREMLKSLV